MLKPQEICIGNVLKDTGYHTGYIGKWHLDASEQNFEKNPVSGAQRTGMLILRREREDRDLITGFPTAHVMST